MVLELWAFFELNPYIFKKYRTPLTQGCFYKVHSKIFMIEDIDSPDVSRVSFQVRLELPGAFPSACKD
jgi:hypothetical protein